jgi:hypothetical protein
VGSVAEELKLQLCRKSWILDSYNNNNKLQLGFHPVAVNNLHVYNL